MKSFRWMPLPKKLKGKPLLRGYKMSQYETSAKPKKRRRLPFISLPSGLFLFEIIDTDKSGVFSDFYLRVKQSYQDSPALRAAVKCNTRMRCLTSQEINALREACGVNKGEALIGQTFLARVQYYEKKSESGRVAGKNQFRPLTKRVRQANRDDENQNSLPPMDNGETGELAGRSRRDCKPEDPEFWEGC